MTEVASISAKELRDLLNKGDEILLIDVREPDEHEAYNIGGILLPLGNLLKEHTKIPSNKVVVLYCEKGIRSMIALQRLQQNFGFINLLNLSGGMVAWRRSLPA